MFIHFALPIFSVNRQILIFQVFVMQIVVDLTTYLQDLGIINEIGLRVAALHAAYGLYLATVFLLGSVNPQELIFILLNLIQFLLDRAYLFVVKLKIRISFKRFL